VRGCAPVVASDSSGTGLHGECALRMRARLAVFQFTREEQPPFSGSNEALAMVVVALRLCELLFGHAFANSNR
jgi:hypothetical protein